MELIVGGGGLVWLSLVLSGFQTCSLSSRTVRTSHEPRIRRTRTLEFFKGSAVGIRVSVYKLFSSLAHASLSSMCLVNFDCFIMSVLANIGESFRYIYIYICRAISELGGILVYWTVVCILRIVCAQTYPPIFPIRGSSISDGGICEGEYDFSFQIYVPLDLGGQLQEVVREHCTFSQTNATE